MVSRSSWKGGIRKVQWKISNFYEVKLRHFDRVRECVGLNCSLRPIDGKEWADDCISKMSSFCICG